jgi:murein DD-endopeptidase MepM/ murein hydrolase activator NlpD
MAKLIFDHNISIHKPQKILKNKIQSMIIFILIYGIFTACVSQEPTSTQVSKPVTSAKTIIPITITQPTTTTKPVLIRTPINSSSPIEENTITTKLVPISPLESLNKEELVNLVSNPFQNPTLGQDDGHHGVDFAFYSYREYESIDNHAVLSILPGKISTVIFNRPPYGNAIIVETELVNIEENILVKIDQLNLSNEIRTLSYLNCPDYSETDIIDASKNESLYVLYGHLKNGPAYEIGEEVFQGELIGNVGNSGNSGNPHLHLETRIGPAHATFISMAHYDNSATLQEMTNYCIWRVSNLFSLFDPIILFEIQPTKP